MTCPAIKPAAALRLLQRLLATGRMVHIVQPTDGHYRVTCDTVTGNGATLGESLGSVVRQALDKPPADVVDPLSLEKRCARCKEVKDLECYPRDASRPDGRFHTCSRCERVRWREKDAARRAKRKRPPGYNNRRGP